MPLDLQGFALPTTDLGLSESPVSFPVEARHLLASSARWDAEQPQHGVGTWTDTHKCIVRTDTDEIVGVVGANYSLLPNSVYFSTIEETMRGAIPGDMWEGVQVRDSLSRAGAFCRREYVFPAYAEQLRNTIHNTDIGLRLIAWNSYDGGTSAGLMSGLIDFYCTNGMVVGKNIASTTARHSSRMDPQVFVEPLRRSIDQTEEMVDEVRRMARTPVTSDDAIEFLEKTFSDRRAGAMHARFLAETEQRGQNVFALLSAMTFYSSHNSEEFPTRGREGTETQTLHGREIEVQRATASPAFRSLLEAA
jgi:hypothetical protein